MMTSIQTERGGAADEWWLENPPIETDASGNLCYELYGQDGSRVAMKCADTRDNRRFIVWVRQHDRYTPRDR